MPSILFLFSLQVLDIFDLDILYFWIFTELAILEWFFTWSFKHARIPLRKNLTQNNAQRVILLHRSM